MGNDNILRTLEEATDKTISWLNEEIKKRDWGKRWQNDFPKTPRAAQETESLKRPEAKEALEEVFSEQSLLLNNLGEVV